MSSAEVSSAEVSSAGPAGSTDQPLLVLVAHGSRDPRAGETVEALASEVRERRPLDVRVAYLDHGEPRLDALLAGLRQPSVVVPLLLTAAYHSGVDIPAAVTAATAPVAQARVLGPDPLLLAALERRLGEAGVSAGDPGTAVVLAAAGASDPAAVDTVRDLARSWAAAGWWAVEPAFASAASPAVEEAVAGLRARGAPRVAVASYLLFPGRFATRLADAGADAVSEPLGAAPEVVTLAVERYDGARSL